MRILKGLIALFEVLLGISSVAASFCLIGAMAGECPVDWLGYCAGMIFVCLISLFSIKIMALFLSTEEVKRMIKIKAKVKGNSVSIKQEVDGCGKDVFNEGIAIIRGVIDIYADAIHESKEDVILEVAALLLGKLEEESALTDTEGERC